MYPVLFTIGSFPVHTYGVLHALAYAAGVWWLVRGAKKARIRTQEIFDLSAVVIVWSIVGARLFSILFDGNLAWYLEHPAQILAIWKGGLTFYGGFVFGLVAGVWFVKKHHLNGWQVADVIAPAIALGAAIGRLGCFASGDSYGKPIDLPWAVTFNDPMALAPKGVALHPTQLYSVITNLAVFGVLLWWQKHRKFQGEVFLLFVLLYAATRLLVEIFRDDPRGVYLGGLVSTSQLISLVAAVIAVFFLFSRSKNTVKGAAV